MVTSRPNWTFETNRYGHEHSITTPKGNRLFISVMPKGNNLSLRVALQTSKKKVNSAWYRFESETNSFTLEKYPSNEHPRKKGVQSNEHSIENFRRFKREVLKTLTRYKDLHPHPELIEVLKVWLGRCMHPTSKMKLIKAYDKARLN